MKKSKSVREVIDALPAGTYVVYSEHQVNDLKVEAARTGWRDMQDPPEHGQAVALWLGRSAVTAAVYYQLLPDVDNASWFEDLHGIRWEVAEHREVRWMPLPDPPEEASK